MRDLSKILTFGKNLFYPGLKCPSCKTYGEGLCIECQHSLIFYEKTSLENASDGISLFNFNQVAQELVSSYKKRGEFFAGEALAKLMVENAGDEMKTFDLITCAPSSKASLKRLGFDHGAHLINLISKEISVPAALLFVPAKNIQKGLDKEERQVNVLGIRLKKSKDGIEGKKVLIIDDVYTTGSTIHRCSSLLKQERAWVKYMTFSRV